MARSQLAYRLIRRAIAEGEFEPGSRLVDQRIGEMFDLSRADASTAERILQGRDSILMLRAQQGCETETHAS